MNSALPLEKELAPFFLETVPAFPAELKDFFVRLAPWLLLLRCVMAGVALLAAFGFGGILLLGSFGLTNYGSPLQSWLAVAGRITMIVLYARAFAPLRAGSRRGWNLVYCALLVDLAVWAFTFQPFALLVGGFLGFWVLFQIREYYR